MDRRPPLDDVGETGGSSRIVDPVGDRPKSTGELVPETGALCVSAFPSLKNLFLFPLVGWRTIGSLFPFELDPNRIPTTLTEFLCIACGKLLTVKCSNDRVYGESVLLLCDKLASCAQVSFMLGVRVIPPRAFVCIGGEVANPCEPNPLVGDVDWFR